MSERTRIVIVGGVAGGASAAARARRLSEQAEITIFERGEYISFANCGLPYHIGGEIADRRRLLIQTPQAMHKRFRIDVRTQTEVMRIDRDAKELVIRELTSGIEGRQRYDKLILSPGAGPFVPETPGVDSKRVLTLRNMADMDAIKARVDDGTNRRAVIVGGGYVGLEMAEALRRRGLPVMLVELTGQVMGPVDPEMAAPLHQQLVANGVDLRLGTKVTAFKENGANLSVKLSTGESVDCSFAIVAIGVRPETKLAQEAGLAIGERGGIVVDDHMRTSDPDIYAVGDAVEVEDWVTGAKALVPLAGPANRQGRIAADNALGRDSSYKKTQGTAICKVFDLSIGMTGANEKSLKRSGKPYEKIYIHPADHASYYPGAAAISLKLLFDPEDGTVLGAQAVGARGIDKRIDVLAVAIRAGLSVYDLEELELAYAPPYGSAKDPVNYAGFVASNVMRGDVKLCHVDDVLNLKADQFLVDVRTTKEVTAGGIPGAVNIPLDELRERLQELPRGKEILITCQVGLRGYLACRILEQNGFTCRNLSGGYKTFAAVTAPVPEYEGGTAEMCDDAGSGSGAACDLPAHGATGA